MIAPADIVAVERVSALGGVDLVRCTFVTRATPRHSHAELEIGVIGSGRRRVWCRGREYLAPAGAILVFRPGEIHAGAPGDETGSTYRSVLLSPDALRTTARWQASSPIWFASPVIDDPALGERFDAALRALERNETGVDADLAAALDDLARLHGTAVPAPAVEHAAIQRVRAHLEANYARQIRLTTLAEIADLSVFHLIRIFREATGLPPYAWLEQLRVDRAAVLLREGCPVSEVAFRTGFSDQSHLTRFFKRLMGVPPGRYQRSALRSRRAAGKIIQAPQHPPG